LIGKPVGATLAAPPYRLLLAPCEAIFTLGLAFETPAFGEVLALLALDLALAISFVLTCVPSSVGLRDDVSEPRPLALDALVKRLAPVRQVVEPVLVRHQ